MLTFSPQFGHLLCLPTINHPRKQNSWNSWPHFNLTTRSSRVNDRCSALQTSSFAKYWPSINSSTSGRSFTAHKAQMWRGKSRCGSSSSFLVYPMAWFIRKNTTLQNRDPRRQNITHKIRAASHTCLWTWAKIGPPNA